MKRKFIIFSLLLSLFCIFVPKTFAIAELRKDEVIRLQCKGDELKRTKYNDAVGTIFTFTLKDGKLYGREGELVKSYKITDEEIKGKLKYRNGFSWENTRFQINRYTGAFNYHTIYRTLETAYELRNAGSCTKIENERKV